MVNSSEIVQAAAFNNMKRVSEIYVELLQERTKMDKWFNKYLDGFSDKMTNAEKTDPMWKLYEAKTKQYSTINSNIRTAEFYLKRNSNV